MAPGTCVAFGALRQADGGGHHNCHHLADGPSGRLWSQDKVVPAVGEHVLPGEGWAIAEVGGMLVGAAIWWEAWFPERSRGPGRPGRWRAPT